MSVRLPVCLWQVEAISLIRINALANRKGWASHAPSPGGTPEAAVPTITSSNVATLAPQLCIAHNYVCLPFASPSVPATCSHWRQRRVGFNCCLLRFFVAAITCCCCCCCVWQGSWHSSREDTPHHPPWPLLPSTPLFCSAWCTPWLICLIDAPLNIAYTYYRWPLAVALHLKCFR